MASNGSAKERSESVLRRQFGHPGRSTCGSPSPLLAKAEFGITVSIPLCLAMTPLNREMKIFSGSAHRDLALRICQAVGAPLGDAVVSSFPDGETRVKINENIRGRDVFIVQPTCPPDEPEFDGALSS